MFNRARRMIRFFLTLLLLAFAGLHLTGNAPTHMMGENGAPHGIQLP